MMATNSPRSTMRLTPRSACTSTSPTRYTRVTLSTLIVCSGIFALLDLGDHNRGCGIAVWPLVVLCSAVITRSPGCTLPLTISV